MKSVINTEKVPIKLWLNDIEEGALNQAKNLANLPFVFRHIAIMPDSHLGYGMPIGGVMATKNVIIPNAVGVDIGCGMIAAKTSTTSAELTQKQLKNIMNGIRRQIPVGFKHQKSPQSWTGFDSPAAYTEIIFDQIESARYQLGSLGGGNHFIEIQKDQDDNVWIMIHSGSRNIGYKIAKHYNSLAVELNKKWFSQVPNEWGLAFLPLEDRHGKMYLDAMNFAVDFALANRRKMLKRIEEILFNVNKIFIGTPINIAHNYAALENHFGQNVIVHRKGATKAYEEQLGIIPGSQGTSSYIVSGKGNPESFKSCSHGAGRVMSRKKAQKELDLEQEKKRLDDLGIIHGIRNQKDLDEASGAYKDISTVMENQSDLVDIVHELKPLAVIKG